MKTRLIIASLFTFTIAAVAAVSMRSSAAAQEEVLEPPKEERLEAAPQEGLPLAEESAEPAEEAADGEFPAETAEADGPVVAEEDASTQEADAGLVQADETESEAALLGTAEDEPTVFHIESFEEVEEDAAVRRTEGAQTLSVDFPDEEIRSILRVVADLFDLNLVIPQELTGRASIKLRDVSWRQVFDVVLSPVGFTWVEEGNIIKVVSLESLTREPPLTKVVILNYAQADQVQRTIEPLVSTTTGGRLQVDKRSNALVITERPTQLRRIESIIEDLDKPNVQVMIESKFIETRNRHIENIGVDWASLDGWGVHAGPFNREYEKQNTRSSEHSRSEKDIDVPFMQQGFDRASQLAGEPVGPAFTERDGQRVYDMGPSSLDSITHGASRTRLDTAVFSADQFSLILSAMRQQNDVKLVSNPTVVTMNNRSAEIHIGEEFPIVLPRFNPQTGTYEAGQYDTIDIGIKLDVTPQVNNAGFITLEVQPDVSTLTSTVSYFGAQYPVRSTRRARSEVTIRDGFTLAIGGLIQEDIIGTERKVPVLGSIPGLGRLFRSDSKDNDQRNLVIFLTARTLDPEGGILKETVNPHQFHRMGLTREEVPGYRPELPLWVEETEQEDEAAEAEEPAAEEVASSPEEATAEPATSVRKDTVVKTEQDLPVEPALLGTADADGSVKTEEIAIDPGEAELEKTGSELEPVQENEAEAQGETEAASATAETEAAPAEEPAAEEAEPTAEEAVEEATEEKEEPAPAQEPRRFRGWLTPGR